MAAFKAGKKDVLIATDVAARGIDVDDVTHVINHTIPDDDKAYLHRVGRTGRAGKTGIAVTFVDWDDLHKWALINRALEFGQPEPTETYSSSPHLYDDLDIPQGTKGRLKPASAAPRSSTAGRTENGSAPRSSTAVRTEGDADAERAPRSTRSRRRTRGGESAEQAGDNTTTTDAPAVREPGTGTHDGKGPEHHDGNSAPQRRRRRRGPRTGGPTPQA
jgi:superfamily II DNA/RNA helicase